jgi:hypothetical protein
VRRPRHRGAAIKIALLTAQRFGKVKEMRRRNLKARMRIQRRMDDNDQWIEGNRCGDPTFI